MRKEMLGTLRSKQQLTTSSAARTCWLEEATWRGTRPTDTYIESSLYFQHKREIWPYLFILCLILKLSWKKQIHLIELKKIIGFKWILSKIFFSVFFTRPEVKSIKTVGVEVIPDSVAPPAFPSTRVRTVALRQSPAHTQVIWLSCEEWLHLVNHHLKVPLLILSGSLACPKKDVGSHAEVWVSKTNTRIRTDVSIEAKTFFSLPVTIWPTWLHNWWCWFEAAGHDLATDSPWWDSGLTGQPRRYIHTESRVRPRPGTRKVKNKLKKTLFD